MQDEQSSSGSEPLELRPGPRKKSGLPSVPKVCGCASGSDANSLPWDSRLELRFLKC